MMKKLFLVLLVGLTGTLLANHVTAEEEEPYDFLEQATTLVDSNLFTQLDDYAVYDQGVIDMSEFQKILENAAYEMWLNEDGLAIRFVDKATGFVWSSDVTNVDDYPLSGAWWRRTRSAVFVDYIDDENRAQETAILHRRSSENPDVTYDVSGNTVTFQLDFTTEEFSFDYSIVLNDDGFDIQMATDSINEYGTNRITKLTFFEFMGTSYEDDIPGYFFLPSGNGALVRFTESSPINSVYRARYYSADIYRSTNARATLLNYPVFGSVYGVDQNAYIGIIKSGSEYAEYTYKPPTFQAEFHMQSIVFLIRENYIQTISGGDSLLIYDREYKDYDIDINVSFLKDSEANYVGMANTFKHHLIDGGILPEPIETTSDIGIHIDTLGKEYEQGLLFKNNYIMTSTSDILDIHRDLQNNGVKNIQFSMRGYNEGGYSDRSYNNYSFDRQIGSVSSLSDLNVLFYYDPTVRYSDSSIVPKNTLLNISKNPTLSSFQRGDYYQFYTDIDAIVDEFDDAYDKLNGYGGILLDGLSNRINTSEEYTRSDIIELYDEILPERVAMIQPNYYMLDNTSMYFQSLLYHNRSRFFTDSVPFEQIVLSGYMPMYSQYLNFSPNINIDVLRLIDFGIYPAFLITEQPSYLLSKTMSSDLYATYYGNLYQYIFDTYDTINDALQYTIGEEIVDRDVVARGVVKVTYSNNVIIYVNYSNKLYLSESLIAVDPISYAVER